MAIDAQHPVDLRGNLHIEVKQRRRELIEFNATFPTQHGGAAVEEELGLEHKPIADHPDVRAIAKNLTHRFNAIQRTCWRTSSRQKVSHQKTE